MRLIDADELKKDDEVTFWISRDAVRTGKNLKMFSELFIRKIDSAPTIEKRNKGKWINKTVKGSYMSYVECSCCKKSYIDLRTYAEMNYCPYCGAEMESEE